MPINSALSTLDYPATPATPDTPELPELPDNIVLLPGHPQLPRLPWITRNFRTPPELPDYLEIYIFTIHYYYLV